MDVRAVTRLTAFPDNPARGTLWKTVRLGGVGLAAGFLLALFALPGAASAAKSAKAIVIEKGCIACHIIPGVPEARGTTGPSLKGMGNRARIASGFMANNYENLRDWLKNPKEIKPDTMMPNLGLSDEEIEILIKFLDTL